MVAGIHLTLRGLEVELPDGCRSKRHRKGRIGASSGADFERLAEQRTRVRTAARVRGRQGIDLHPVGAALQPKPRRTTPVEVGWDQRDTLTLTGGLSQRTLTQRTRGTSGRDRVMKAEP